MQDNESLNQHIQQMAHLYLDHAERDPRVLQAMRAVDRLHFIPAPAQSFAYDDAPVPIGYGQTCSQPSMVAFMLDKLQIQPGHKILEIGAGCGYAAAIAARLCGESGTVYACEIVPELAAMMQENLKDLRERIHILSGDGSAGFPQYAPFDRIFLSAGVASSSFDQDILLKQLTRSGILLYPEMLGNLYKFTQIGKEVTQETYYGVSFVPLIGENS